jgi:hypothetical protein
VALAGFSGFSPVTISALNDKTVSNGSPALDFSSGLSPVLMKWLF